MADPSPRPPNRASVGIGITVGFVVVMVVLMLTSGTLPGTIPVGSRYAGGPAHWARGAGPRSTSPSTAPLPQSPSGATTTPGQPAPAPAPVGGRANVPAGQATSGEPVTLVLGGDVHFEPPIRLRLNNPDSALTPVKELMAGGDIKMVNLETAITERGKREPKTYTFRAPASALSALRAAGVDVVSGANNHGVDFGATGLTDTIDSLEKSGLKYVGIGSNAQRAYAPHVAEVKGRRIAIFGITQVMDDFATRTWPARDDRAGLAWSGDVNRMVERIRAVRNDVDTIVVYVHWGVEGQHCPTAAQQKLAAQLAEAGADAVVGGHAHRLQGFGQMGNTFVAYGLGNLVFYAKPDAGSDSGVLRLTLAGRKVTESTWTPARIQAGVPQRLTGARESAAQAQMARYKACSKLT